MHRWENNFAYNRKVQNSTKQICWWDFDVRVFCYFYYLRNCWNMDGILASNFKAGDSNYVT